MSHSTSGGENATGNSTSEKPHSVLTYTFWIVHWLCNVLGWYNKNDWPLQPVKIGLQDESQPIKWSQIIYYLICFPFLLLLSMARKFPVFKNTYINKKLFPIRIKSQSKVGKYSWTS